MSGLNDVILKVWQFDCLEIVKAFLNLNRSSLNQIGSFGLKGNLLHFSCLWGRAEIVSFLLSQPDIDVSIMFDGRLPKDIARLRLLTCQEEDNIVYKRIIDMFEEYETKKEQENKRSEYTQKDISAWTAKDVFDWLSQYRPEHASILFKQEIDGEALLNQTVASLHTCGIPVGPASKIFSLISTLHNRTDKREGETLTARVQPGPNFITYVPKAKTDLDSVLNSLHQYADTRSLDANVIERVKGKFSLLIDKGYFTTTALSLTICWAYTMESWIYQHVNTLLRRDGEDIQILAPFMNGLMQSFKYMDEGWYYSGTLYRRARITEKDIEFYSPKTMFVWSSFTSTRTEFSRDSSFGEVLFIIRIPEDKKPFALRIEKVSDFPEEKEVLVLPNVGFEVLSVKKGVSEWENTSYVIEIQVSYICVL
eukprot:TRINITY_DN22940_c0_g1_i1.p1 TRINITY_DN22940_c0_g1~~TRINITY_DN22940_c0_g1_i1.p1  ORF type:complete len:430 (-),score=70.89 TRINITY_DN22940_c0_g1_i1:42-1310(-)